MEAWTVYFAMDIEFESRFWEYRSSPVSAGSINKMSWASTNSPQQALLNLTSHHAVEHELHMYNKNLEKSKLRQPRPPTRSLEIYSAWSLLPMFILPTFPILVD